jgi:hypothetical protein
MYKAAAKFQQHRARLLAERKRSKPLLTPLAARYADSLNAFSQEFFGKPCRALSKKQLRELAARVRAGPVTSTASPSRVTSAMRECPFCHQMKKGLEDHIKAKHSGAPQGARPSLPPALAQAQLSAPASPAPVPQPAKLDIVTTAALEARRTGWDGIVFPLPEPPAWATSPKTPIKRRRPDPKAGLPETSTTS